MAKFPAMPLCFDAYWQDCSHLSDAEHGRYLLVMRALWMAPGQRLPNDAAWLARHFRRTEVEVAAEIRPIMAEFCQCDGNWWSQKRLTREFARVAKTRQKQSERAKSGWTNGKGLSRGNAAAMPRHSQAHARVSPAPEPRASALEKTNQESRTDSQASFPVEIPNHTQQPEQGTPMNGVVEQPDLDFLLFQRGKVLLGRKSGGQIAKLRDACGGVGAALQVIDDAAHKESPAEYVAAVIRNNTKGRNGNGTGKHEDWYGRRILERAVRRAEETEGEPCPGLFELESRAPVRRG